MQEPNNFQEYCLTSAHPPHSYTHWKNLTNNSIIQNTLLHYFFFPFDILFAVSSGVLLLYCNKSPSFRILTHIL